MVHSPHETAHQVPTGPSRGLCVASGCATNQAKSGSDKEQYISAKPAVLMSVALLLSASCDHRRGLSGLLLKHATVAEGPLLDFIGEENAITK
jgi:hypothetical protein